MKSGRTGPIKTSAILEFQPKRLVGNRGKDSPRFPGYKARPQGAGEGEERDKRRNFGFVDGRKYYSSDPKWVLRREREQRLKEIAQADATSTVLRLLASDDTAALHALDPDTLGQAVRGLKPADFKRLLRAWSPAERRSGSGVLPYRGSDMLPEKPNETDGLSGRNRRSRVVSECHRRVPAIEIAGTGQRMTVMADSTSVELVAKAKAGQGFTKAPKGRQPKLIPDRE